MAVLRRRKLLSGLGLTAATLGVPAWAQGTALVDGAGRRLTLPRRIERVLPAGTPAAVKLYTLAPQTLLGWPRANPQEEHEFLLPGVGNRPTVGWITSRGHAANLESVLAERPDLYGTTVSILPRLALVDYGAWVLPLIALAVAAPRAGIGDRFVHYVVANNWGSAIIAWLMLPPSLLRLVSPASSDLADLLALLLFGVTLVLSWRLTNAALEKGAAIATALFTALFVAALAVLFGLQALFGLNPPVPA